MMSAETDHATPRRNIDYLVENVVAGAGVTTLVAAAFLLVVVSGLLPPPVFGVAPLAVWFTAISLASLYRVRLHRTFPDHTTPAGVLENWLRRFRFGSALTGLCWGLLAALAMFAPSDMKMVALLIVGAMGVAAIPYLAADGPSYNLYLAGCVVPLVPAALLSNSAQSMLALGFAVLYALGVWQSARNYNNMLVSSLDLQAAANRLSSKLAAANQQLEAELEHRNQVARQLQQARTTAESANRAKTVFLSRMSHELRTPLNAVLGFTELLSMMPDNELAGKKSEYLTKIKSSGSHLLSLIEDILDITRIDDGRIQLHAETIAIGDVIADCLAMLEQEAVGASISVHVDPDSDAALEFSSDRLRFRQILLNLLTNAIKYNKPNGRIDVRYFETDNDFVCIEVQDTGIGIESEDIDKAFQPFVRLQHGSLPFATQGTGIGLTITKQLTELMGGTIEVASPADGGTCMTVRFPRSLDTSSQIRATGT